VNRISRPPTDPRTLATLLKALGEPKRLLILHLLMEGVQCNCELGDALDLPPNLVSHHLRILREAGLVSVERDLLDSRWAYYSVDRAKLGALRASFTSLVDPGRIKQRRPNCGPRVSSDRLPLREAAGRTFLD
jgi:ArsR family transcriptional regulator